MANLVKEIREIAPEEVETFRHPMMRELVTVGERDGKFILGRTDAQQQRYLERRAGVLENGKDEDDTEEPESEYADDVKPLSASTGPRPLVVGGPCVSPKNAERDRTHAWAIELHKGGMPSGEIVIQYVEKTKTDPRRLGAEQARIVIVDRACRGRPCTDFDCERFERPPEKKLVHKEHTAPLWENWLYYGALAGFGGDPGVGKTKFTRLIGASVTRGGPRPDGSGNFEQGRVLFFCAERKEQYTFDKDMARWEADLSRVEIVWDSDFQANLRSEHGRKKIRAKIAEFEPDLIVFDPIEIYLGLKTGEAAHIDVVAQLFLHVIYIAADTNAAVIFTRYIKKGRLAGCDSFDGACDRIKLIEWYPGGEYKHLDPSFRPRVIRDSAFKRRTGDGHDPIQWERAPSYAFSPIGRIYLRTLKGRAHGVLRQLFPLDRTVKTHSETLWAERDKHRIGERTFRDAMRKEGIIELPGSRAEGRYYVRESTLPIHRRRRTAKQAAKRPRVDSES